MCGFYHWGFHLQSYFFNGNSLKMDAQTTSYVEAIEASSSNLSLTLRLRPSVTETSELMRWMFLSCTKGITNPIGWPRLTAPPWMFTLAGSMSSSFMLANTTTLNASLISHKAISSFRTPAFSSNYK